MAAIVDLRMPGVKTVEMPTLAPTVAVVPSAIPVFIGYTEKAERRGEDLTGRAIRIKSMNEYENWFGGPKKVSIKVDIDGSNPTIPGPVVTFPEITGAEHKMHYALQLYYANGGGPCFILSVGDYDAQVQKDDLKIVEGGALEKQLKLAKDITIIVFPDATSMTGENDHKEVIEEALKHCNKVHNRVTIIDVPSGDAINSSVVEDATAFQTQMPRDINFKKYGMAYYPFLETGLTYAYDNPEVLISLHIRDLDEKAAINVIRAIQPEGEKAILALNDIVNNQAFNALTDTAAVPQEVQDKLTVIINFFKKVAADAEATALEQADNAKKVKDGIAGLDAKIEKYSKAIEKIHDRIAFDRMSKKVQELQAKSESLAKIKEALLAIRNPFPAIEDPAIDDETKLIAELTKINPPDTDLLSESLSFLSGMGNAVNNIDNYSGFLLSDLEEVNDVLLNTIRDAIRRHPVTMPPSAAIAGIYVRTDATQGVWKAPANTSVFGTISPAIELDDDDHANLNAPDNGKAINAIRAYPGRGILVYGARTLAGNDLEWRYVSVRRTFCFIEDSIGRAMQDFVFENNTSETWIKVRSMINSFLNRIWKAGGLYGLTPEDAYQVIVGEPDSMSVDDVLNGVLRVIVKVAVARPAEFIVLQYEHKFDQTN